MLYTIIDSRPNHDGKPVSFMIRNGNYAVPLHMSKEGAQKSCNDLNRNSHWPGIYKVVKYTKDLEEVVNRAYWSTRYFE